MKQLALVTWRLPHAGLARLEDAREAVGDLELEADVFALATCQRSLACTLAEDPRQAGDRLARRTGPPEAERYAGPEAFAHLARVAASLDALVPGEDQVASQFRQALDDQADELERPLLQRLQRVRALARQARRAGGLTGHESRSIVQLAEHVIPEDGPLAIVGTGTIARQAVKRLGDRPVHVVSRSRERATELADDPSRAWSRAAFVEDPPSLRGLVLSTRAPEDPVLDEAQGRWLAEAREGQDPLAVVDLGVPRNADPGLHRHADVRLRTMEDLARIARASPLEDPRVREAEAALEEALANERKRRRGRRLDERVVALRDQLADEIGDLVDEIEGLADDERRTWIERAHGRLAHASQQHLEAAVRRDPPP